MPLAPAYPRALRLFALLAALLVTVEGASYGILSALAWRDRGALLPSRSMSAYQGQPWADALWREQKQQMTRPYEAHPYGLWRAAPVSGETIVVDAMGVRRTAHSLCVGDAPTVYVFGGSSLWGYGSPDWETIPSHLARRFAAEGKPACVVNLGSDAWRADQGVVKLVQELKRPGARRPDVVVFLNGCNDVLTPFFLTGRVDWEWEFQQSKEWLDELMRIRDGSLRYLRVTNTWTLGQRLVRRLEGPKIRQMPSNPDRLAHAIAANYLGNIRIVDGLSRSHGFRYAFFWQPMSIAGRKVLTAEEDVGTRVGFDRSFPDARTAVGMTLTLLRDAAAGRFHDLTGAFDDQAGSVYIDFCHLLPEGNRLLADRIYEVIK
jgi:lysophospholipase L1-like esterase